MTTETSPPKTSPPGASPRTAWRRSALAAVVALAGLTAVPTLATAGTVALEGDALVFRAAPGEANDLFVNDEGTEFVFSDSALLTGPPELCERGEFDPEGLLRCAPQPGGIRVELGDGNDRARLGMGWAIGTPITIDAGPGDDELTGYHGPETLHGGDGNDVLKGNQGNDRLFGDAGNDTVEGGDDADEVRGGEGDDTVGGGGTSQAADIIDGGPGRDTLSEYEYTAGGSQAAPTAPITLTLGGGADDGRPGEGDDVTGIEVAKLLVAANVTAGAGPVELAVFRTQALPSQLIGTDQADTLTGFDFADRIDGGAGPDTIVGGYGDDTINPGPGRDAVNADTSAACNFFECRPPHGNDTIDARDGEVDSITCGVGQDTVRADPADIVAPDCESVERSGTSGGSGGTSDKDGKGGAGKKARKLGVAVPKKLTAKAIRKGTKLAVTVPKAGRVTLTLTRRVGRASRTFATGKATAKAAGPLKVRLRARGSKLPRGSYRLKLTLRPKSGKATSVTRTVKVR